MITGGTSMMKNINEAANKVFNASVRTGYPRDISGLSQIIENPRYATAVGLLKRGKIDFDSNKRQKIDGNSIMQILHRMKIWFQGNF